ncbi:nucleotidyltransferase [Pseudobdellovibrio sp. HCB154]|uniref:nucleotidyltransferase n=1 Tax=Pseudobdellovibrio sp. HCB154 TaxID=3386277 RepID=UPI003916D21E
MLLNNHEVEEFISEISKSIEVPPSRYESVETSYQSIAAWLKRDASTLKVDIQVYSQGSFRLGTAIRPVNDEENYDVDVVFEVSLDKLQITQKELQEKFGVEIKAYADAHNMSKPDQWDRVWTLNYADSAQFHMDILPCIPDGEFQFRLIEGLKFSPKDIFRKSVAITDRRHANFTVRSSNWPTSNPNGYAQWFYDRMVAPVVTKSLSEAVRGKVEVADLPSFKSNTPLQAAVKLLKRHRDIHFTGKLHLKPSSIILTTLAAHAFQYETDLTKAIQGILLRFEEKLFKKGNDYWVENPSDPRENFADSWKTEQNKATEFFGWLKAARDDFQVFTQVVALDRMAESLSHKLGEKTLAKSLNIVKTKKQLTVSQPKTLSAYQAIIASAPHRMKPLWPVDEKFNVKLVVAQYSRVGHLPVKFQSGDDIPIGRDLSFRVETNVPRPFKVFWQVVNTGDDAANDQGLRGDFNESNMEEGGLKRHEKSRYQGTHSIECFIVKDYQCVARSGIFIVNIG